MPNSKDKFKKNPAVPGEPLSQKEFKALIKEAEKGPFSPLGNLVEDVKLRWEKKQKTEKKTNSAHPDESFTKEEFVALVKEGEKGPFYSHMELTDKFDAWKKTLKSSL
jgi:hypothetical protein